MSLLGTNNCEMKIPIYTSDHSLCFTRTYFQQTNVYKVLGVTMQIILFLVVHLDESLLQDCPQK